mgnify:CR=1 FL=1
MSASPRQIAYNVVAMAKEQIPADNAARAQGLLVTALFLFGAAAVGTWWFEVPLDLQTRSPAVAFPLFVAPLGVVFLVLYARDAMRIRKYGTSMLEADVPTKDGRWSGAVRTTSDLATIGDYVVSLKCYEPRPATSSHSKHTAPILKWSADQTVNHTMVRASAGVPFEFSLPGREVKLHEAKTTWYVEIKAPMKGTDYYAIFTVGVLLRKQTGEPGLPWWSAP